MATETSDEIKAIRILPFSGKQEDWDEWSQKYLSISAERGYAEVMLGTVVPPADGVDINRMDGDPAVHVHTE